MKLSLMTEWKENNPGFLLLDRPPALFSDNKIEEK
jgi:hypothetical protein